MPAQKPPFELPPHVVVLRFDAPTGDPRESVVFRLINDEDKPQMAALLEEMKANPERIYIIDLTGRTFCGTMRLGHLLRMQQALRLSGRVLRIAVDQKELIDVFRLTRLNTIMQVFSTLVDAAADAVRPI